MSDDAAPARAAEALAHALLETLTAMTAHTDAHRVPDDETALCTGTVVRLVQNTPAPQHALAPWPAATGTLHFATPGHARHSALRWHAPPDARAHATLLRADATQAARRRTHPVRPLDATTRERATTRLEHCITGTHDDATGVVSLPPAHLCAYRKHRATRGAPPGPGLVHFKVHHDTVHLHPDPGLDAVRWSRPLVAAAPAHTVIEHAASETEQGPPSGAHWRPDQPPEEPMAVHDAHADPGLLRRYRRNARWNPTPRPTVPARCAAARVPWATLVARLRALPAFTLARAVTRRPPEIGLVVLLARHPRLAEFATHSPQILAALLAVHDPDTLTRGLDAILHNRPRKDVAALANPRNTPPGVAAHALDRRAAHTLDAIHGPRPPKTIRDGARGAAEEEKAVRHMRALCATLARLDPPWYARTLAEAGPTLVEAVAQGALTALAYAARARPDAPAVFHDDEPITRRATRLEEHEPTSFLHPPDIEPTDRARPPPVQRTRVLPLPWIALAIRRSGVEAAANAAPPRDLADPLHDLIERGVAPQIDEASRLAPRLWFMQIETKDRVPDRLDIATSVVAVWLALCANDPVATRAHPRTAPSAARAPRPRAHDLARLDERWHFPPRLARARALLEPAACHGAFPLPRVVERLDARLPDTVSRITGDPHLRAVAERARHCIGNYRWRLATGSLHAFEIHVGRTPAVATVEEIVTNRIVAGYALQDVRAPGNRPASTHATQVARALVAEWNRQIKTHAPLVLDDADLERRRSDPVTSRNIPSARGCAAYWDEILREVVPAWLAPLHPRTGIVATLLKEGSPTWRLARRAARAALPHVACHEEGARTLTHALMEPSTEERTLPETPQGEPPWQAATAA